VSGPAPWQRAGRVQNDRSLCCRRYLPWLGALVALSAGPLAAAQGALGHAAPNASSAAPGSSARAPAASSGQRVTPTARAAGSTTRPGARFSSDPPASMTRRKWAYDVRLKGGSLSAAAPTSIDRGRAVATPRFLGRFAIELYVGSLLLERVRFNLPLVDDGPAADGEAAPTLSPKLTTHRVVEVPDLERATRAELVDSATGKRQRLVWPPVDAPPAPAPPASQGARPPSR
jgi:hypothetical protein